MQKDKTLEGLERASINEVLAVIAYALVEINDKLAALDKGISAPVTQVTDYPPEEDLPWPVETKTEAPAPAPEPEPAAPAHTLEDIRGLMRQFTAKGIPEKCKALLKGRGCSKVSDLKPGDIEEVYAELTAMLGEVV